MKIAEIKPGMDGINIVGRVVQVGQRRIVETRFGKASVATAILEDESGRVLLNLWRHQIDLVKEGDVIRVENAFTRVYKGKIELNVGSRGKIIVLHRG